VIDNVWHFGLLLMLGGSMTLLYCLGFCWSSCTDVWTISFFLSFFLF